MKSIAGVIALLVALTSCGLETNEAALVDPATDTTAVAAANGDTTVEAPTDTEAPADTSGGTFAVGDRVALGDWELVVHAVTDPYEASDEFFAPEEGNRWVLVDAEVFYNGADPQVVSTPLCFEVQDAENRAHPESFGAENPIGLLDGDIAAGAARRGGIIYEVPAAATGLRLNFKCDLLSAGNATVALG